MTAPRSVRALLERSAFRRRVRAVERAIGVFWRDLTSETEDGELPGFR